jgi:methyl-accepting chemotaxis protein
MVFSRFRRAIASVAGPRKRDGDGPNLFQHAARIIDEMAVAAFVLDRDGRVAIWNDACARLTGLGVDLVGQTGKAPERIVAQVVEIDNVVSAIAKSADEQAGALQQVDRAVSQMDQSTQRNADMAQRTTAAARALAAQTGELEELTSCFAVSRSGARGAPRRVRAARVAAE